MHLQLDYVTPEKLLPEKLLHGALKELGRMVPEVWVVAEMEAKGSGLNLKIMVENEYTVLSVSELRGLSDLQHILQKLIQQLLKMNLQQSQLKIEQVLASGILNMLDAYSVLLPHEIYNEFNINIGGQFAGVGLVVGIRDDQLTVIAPMDGSPAALAGMLPLDRIVAVDRQKTKHMTLDEILHRMRGKIGTSVRLSVLRKGQAKTLEFELLRTEIKLESVEAFNLESGSKTIRYVRIKNFQIDTAQELKKKLGELNNIQGLILDLRNNPGGLLEEAVRVSDLFLRGKKRIVSTRGTNLSTIHNAKNLFAEEHLLKIPLVVLINRGSASASEIVAAAFKQNKRALVVGEQSFGKGTVQTLWNMKDGSGLKLTIAEYLTPSGLSIHNVGVMPSLQMVPVNVPEFLSQESEFSSQYRRFGLLPETLSKEAKNDARILQLSYLSANVKLFDETEIIVDSEKINKLDADIFIKIAKNVLSQADTENHNSTVRKIYRQTEQLETKKIIAALAKHGIDWSLNPYLKNVTADKIKLNWFAEKVAEDILKLTIQLKNNGENIIQRLLVVTKSANALLDGLEFPIGKLEPEREATRSLYVKIPAGMMEELEPVQLVLFDYKMEKLKSVQEKLVFPAKRISAFMLRLKIYDNGKFGSQGNGDGKVQVGETIALRFIIANSSKNSVPELLLKIRGLDGNFKIDRGKIVLKNLLPKVKYTDHFIFETFAQTKNLGKISLEIVDTKSGHPGIDYLWDLEKTLPVQRLATPKLFGVNWQDKKGNIVEAVTDLESLVLRGKVSNTADIRDVFVHLNDQKVFYSVNNSVTDGIAAQEKNKNVFNFKTALNLVPGRNQISIYYRSRTGFTSERRFRIMRSE